MILACLVDLKRERKLHDIIGLYECWCATYSTICNAIVPRVGQRLEYVKCGFLVYGGCWTQVYDMIQHH